MIVKRFAPAAVLVVCFVAMSTAQAARPVTTVTVKNPSGVARPAGPATFGVFLAKGDVKESVAAQGLATQADVKRHWDDGSIKHAIVTVALPAMEAGAKTALAIVPAKTVRADPLSMALPDMQLRFEIHNGPTEVATLAKATKTGEWLAGAEAIEWLLTGVPYDVTITSGGKELFARKQVGRWPDDESCRGHTKWSRWVKRFWIGRKLDDV